MINVNELGIYPGATDHSVRLQQLLHANPWPVDFYFPPSHLRYSFAISIQRDDVGLHGEGEGTCFQHPSGALHPGGLIEIGNTALGNTAPEFKRIRLKNFSADGNKANTDAPISDCEGHVIIATHTKGLDIEGVKAKNGHNSGIAIVIWSDGFRVRQAVIEDCGSAIHTGPGWEVNSSSNGEFEVRTYRCYDGGRSLDNVYGSKGVIEVYDAMRHGFIYNNQTSNASAQNDFWAKVYGCGENAVILGDNISGGSLRVETQGAGYAGVNANDVKNVRMSLRTVESQGPGLIATGEFIGNRVRHTSLRDGRDLAQGDYFAIDVSGSGNDLHVETIDSDPWQVRGLVMRPASFNNRTLSHYSENTAQPYLDQGTGNSYL